MSYVAVIVPVFNAEHLIGATIESILSQDCPDLSVYIVDDGSTDGTTAVIESFKSDPRVRCLQQQNKGQAAAINLGIRQSQEPYISLCDADDLWRTDRIGKVLAALKANPLCGMVCNDFAIGSDPRLPWVSAWQTLGYRPISGQAFGRLLEQNFIPRSGVLIPRPVLEKVGMFSEAIAGKCGSDDRDMWLKIANDRPILCIHETLTFKRVVEGQNSGTLTFYEGRVRLWDQWERRLRGNDRALHREAHGQLATALSDLAYKRISEGGDRAQARKEIARAARLGASLPAMARLLLRSFVKEAWKATLVGPRRGGA